MTGEVEIRPVVLLMQHCKVMKKGHDDDDDDKQLEIIITSYLSNSKS